MIEFGTVKPGRTLYVPFDSFASSTGASITLTGLAVADIEIYKDGSTTQRASDNGYTLLDTDGIDFDGLTGIHGFSVNLADNSDAGFYAAGSRYFIVVSSVTVDSQTVSFVAATFSIGHPDAVLNTTIATLATQTSFTLTAGPAEDDALNDMWLVVHDVASAVQMAIGVISDYTGSTKTVTLAAAPTFTIAATDNISVMGPMPLQPTVSQRRLDVSTGGEAGVDWANVGSPTTTLNLSGTTISTSQAIASVSGAVGSVTGAVGSVTGNVGGNVVGSVASVTGNVGGNVVGSVGSVTGAVGSVTSSVTVGTNNDKTGYSLTATTGLGNQTANITGSLSGSVGSVLGGINTTGGTITTLDALDTAQDTQHSTTQSAVADVQTDVDAVLVDTDQLQTLTVIRQATAQAGSSGSITLDASASALAEFYKHSYIRIVSGTGAGQNWRVINAYNETTKVASVTPVWSVSPDNTSVFVIAGSAESHVRQVEQDALTASALAADAVAEIQSGLATQASVNTIDDYLDTEIASIISSLTSISSALTTVDSVVDAILLDTGTDGVLLAAAAIDSIHDEPITEPTARPAWASMTHRKLMQTLGALMLNEIDSDSNSVDVRNDADTDTIWAYTSSDDGSTYISGKAA